MFWALLTLVASIVRSAIALFRSREDQAIVELALRQQLAVYVHRHPKPRLSPRDRAFWVALSRFWPHWRSVVVVVQPDTVIRWHRKAFRGYWRWISKPGPSDFRGNEGPDRPNGEGERLASAEGPSRTIEAGDPPRLDDHLPILAKDLRGREPTPVRRELLDHVVVLSEDHLRRLLREYVEYYNTDRVHSSIGDSPAGRSSETKPSAELRSFGSRAWAASMAATPGAMLLEAPDE